MHPLTMHALSFRPFGDAADLDLDFGQAQHPELVTALLAGCSRGVDAGFWWAQPVGARTAALLELVGASEATAQLEFAARCLRDGCGAPFEFTLPLHGLRELADDAPIHIDMDADRSVTLRRPNGGDLLALRGATPATREEAVGRMLRMLLVEGEVRPDEHDFLSAAVAARDPLVDFAVECACPACGAVFDVAVDLESVALARLARRQDALLREVHQFAMHYGWTEQEVLAVPARRRARYLALLGEAP